MFTGIIEEIGKITNITPISNGKRLKVKAKRVIADLAINDSISISGVCLTVIKLDDATFTVEAVGDTLKKTTIHQFRINTLVNLERALSLSDRLGGHLIQGHVNGIGKISAIQKRGDNWFFKFTLPKNQLKYVIQEGSISIDGVSLTVANLNNVQIGISIIPHTFKNTIFQFYRLGQKVNIETDFMARYVENFVAHGKLSANKATFL
jgi:riboflavin synthase